MDFLRVSLTSSAEHGSQQWRGLEGYV